MGDCSEEEEVEKVEREIEEMRIRVCEFRANLPPQIVSDKILYHFSPIFTSGPSILAEGGPLVGEDKETAERAQVLKQKISDNISAIPVLSKRMRDVVSKLDKLDSCNVRVPCVYKKKRTS